MQHHHSPPPPPSLHPCQDVAPITGHVPDPAQAADPARTSSMQRSLDYMGLAPGTSLEGLKVDKVFIGSCTNAR